MLRAVSNMTVLWNYGLQNNVYYDSLATVYTQNWVDVTYFIVQQAQYLYLSLIVILDASVAQVLAGQAYIYL